MTVLKDAASTALYGARGANGIILITTKKARSGKINVDMKWGSNSRAIPEYDVITDPGRYYEAVYSEYYNKYYYGEGFCRTSYIDGKLTCRLTSGWQDCCVK